MSLFEFRVLETSLIVGNHVEFGAVLFIVYEAVASDHDRGFFRPCAAEVDHRVFDGFLLDRVLVGHVFEHFGVIGDDAVYFSTYEHADILIRGQGVDDVHFIAFGIAVVFENLASAHANLRRFHHDKVLTVIVVDSAEKRVRCELYRIAFFIAKAFSPKASAVGLDVIMLLMVCLLKCFRFHMLF